jgi:hypothetical protein
MSKIHAYMKQRFNMNTYELARSLMMAAPQLVRASTICTAALKSILLQAAVLLWNI